MQFVRCPECHSVVDLNSEIRYSPDRGVNIFHAPCYIARRERHVQELERALEGVVESLSWASGASDFAPEGRAREGWLKGPMIALARARIVLEKAGLKINA